MSLYAKQSYDLVGWFKGTRSKAEHELSIGMGLVVLFVIVLGMSCLLGVSSSSRTNNYSMSLYAKMDTQTAL
jgi:hypothetical protein